MQNFLMCFFNAWKSQPLSLKWTVFSSKSSGEGIYFKVQRNDWFLLDIKYNEEKEEKAKKEKKRLQIENIEEARRLEEERKLGE